jgi:ParB-like chromosome segregation protein Spo0J
MTIQIDRTLAADMTDDEPSINDDRGSIITTVDQLPEVSVPIGSLLPSLYLRESGTSHAHVQLLADAAESSALPPILVQQYSHRVIDGMHRLAAAKLRGEKSIKARFVDCADEEALFLAIKSNTLHGLPLSRADRISGAKRILASHPDWSDRAVASIAGISARTVAILRNRSADNIRSFEKRLGRDGKRRPVTGTDGRRRAAEYINAHPDASLRQVARETDVSLGTVHNVLQLIRSGIDPAATPPEPPAEPRPAAERTAADRMAADAAPGRPSLISITSTRSEKDARQLNWAEIQSKLVNDPSLRYREGGRAFLRWMALHAMQAGQWREFVEAVPIRWAGDISAIADNMAIEWQTFAERLRDRHQSAG